MRKQERRKRNTFVNIIKAHIINNIKAYMIVSIIFLIGIVLGVIFINNMEQAQQSQVDEYINTFINCLKTDYAVDSSELLKTSIIDNILVVLLIWFMGMSVVGIPVVYAVVLAKGFSLGYTISSAMATLGLGKGILFNVVTLLFQNIIYIPCMFAISVSGIKLYKSIMKDRRKENIKVEICRHTIFSFIIGLILVSTAFIETYVSSNLLAYVVQYL